jgi:hypothetical protein
LRLRFDSVQAAGGSWAAMAAILDSLEWAGTDRLTDSGALYGNGRSFKQIAGTTGGAGVVAAATGIGVIPVIAVTGLNVLRPGARAQILAAQEGVLRLTAPLVLSVPDHCSSMPAVAVSGPVPALPALRTRTTNKTGDVLGDPINVAVQGTRDDLEAAFTRAGWLAAERPTPGHLAQGVGAAIVEASAPRAPVSHQYYFGRVEDLAFERSSPSARERHHVRVWQADSAGTLWVGAANEDIGLLIKPLKGRATHRIDPAIDHERELLTRELLAGGCASFAGTPAWAGCAPRPMSRARRSPRTARLPCCGSGALKQTRPRRPRRLEMRGAGVRTGLARVAGASPETLAESGCSKEGPCSHE